MRSSQDGGWIEKERKSEAGDKREESVNKTERLIRDIKRRWLSCRRNELPYKVKQNGKDKWDLNDIKTYFYSNINES